MCTYNIIGRATEVDSQNQESSLKSLNISEMNKNKSAKMKC